MFFQVVVLFTPIELPINGKCFGDTFLPATSSFLVSLCVDTQAGSAVPRALDGKLVIQGGLSASLFILRRVLSRINSLLRGVDVMRHDGNIVLLE
jgi:hypothetical protein